MKYRRFFIDIESRVKGTYSLGGFELKTKIIIVFIILILSCPLSHSISSESNAKTSEAEKLQGPYNNYTKLEIIDFVYDFEKLMNKKDDIFTRPEGFIDANLEDLLINYYCKENGLIIGENDEKCTQFILESAKSPQGPESYLFKFLKSEEGPFKLKPGKKEIKIYIRGDFTIPMDNLMVDVDTVVITEDKRTIPCTFIFTKSKDMASVIGIIADIKIDSKSIHDHAREYYNERGIYLDEKDFDH